MNENTGPVADLLRRARARISTPDRWTKGQDARNPTGHDVPPTSASACQWCALGAVLAVDSAHERAAIEELSQVLGARPPEEDSDDESPLVSIEEHVTGYNDDPKRTHAEVLAWFDAAIGRVSHE